MARLTWAATHHRPNRKEMDRLLHLLIAILAALSPVTALDTMPNFLSSHSLSVTRCWAARSKVCAVFKYSLPRCEIWSVIVPSRGSLAPGLRRFGARAANCGHLPGSL